MPRQRKPLTQGTKRPKPDVKPACEIKHAFMCTGVGLRHLQGVLKDDPKFYACMGCVVWLRRNKVRFREAK